MRAFRFIYTNAAHRQSKSLGNIKRLRIMLNGAGGAWLIHMHTPTH
jgi:hypothetical protein